MSDKTYKFDVAMSCGGCSGAVNRKLSKLDGIKSYKVTLDTQEVLVVPEDPAKLTFQEVLSSIEATKKAVKASEEVDGDLLAGVEGAVEGKKVAAAAEPVA